MSTSVAAARMAQTAARLEDKSVRNTSSDGLREVKRRVRTGCFNCRKKHKKCDEQKPICKACAQRTEECRWPESTSANKNKRRRANNKFNSNNSASPYSAELEAIDTYSKNLENLDNSLATETVQPNHWNNVIGNASNSPEDHYLSDHSHQRSISSGISPGPNSHHTRGSLSAQGGDQQSIHQPLQDEHNVNGGVGGGEGGGDGDQVPQAPVDFPFAFSPPEFDLMDYDDLKLTLRDYMFANATNLEAGSALPLSMAQTSSPGTSEQETPVWLTMYETKMLLKNYLYNVAPWLDMFDLSRQFGLETTQLSKTSKGLRYALLALSARQKEKLDASYDPSKSKILYQLSLKHLIPSVKNTPDITAISTCVLLCVIEMMSVAPEKWRYHIEGCAALFKAMGINGFSSKYERAMFWCFARMDVNSGVVGEQKTMIQSDKWLPQGVSVYDAHDLFVHEKSIDMYANYMVFLCSRVLNLIATEDAGDFDKEWEKLWNEVNQWHSERPTQMQSIIEFDSSPFPEVLYDNGPAISSNQLYHMAIILLYEVKPRGFKIDMKAFKPATWHAKQVCAISIHNDHHGCWNNSVQSLYVAGKLLTHKDEHKIVLELLDTIERTTGWYMKFRAKDLMEYWDQI